MYSAGAAVMNTSAFCVIIVSIFQFSSLQPTHDASNDTCAVQDDRGLLDYLREEFASMKNELAQLRALIARDNSRAECISNLTRPSCEQMITTRSIMLLFFFPNVLRKPFDTDACRYRFRSYYAKIVC